MLLSTFGALSMLTVCKWLGVYLCMRESPATTPAELDTYKVVVLSKGIHQFDQVVLVHGDVSFLSLLRFVTVFLGGRGVMFRYMCMLCRFLLCYL